MRMYLPFLGVRYSSVTKVMVYSLKRISMGGTAKSVDYQPMRLRVGRWKIWVMFSEKLEEEMSS